MDTIVRLVAPRGRLDFALKVLGTMLILGMMNWLRDIVEHGSGADSYLSNFREAGVVGILPTLLAFKLIGHLDRLQEDLVRASVTDPLTGLPNRRHFFDEIARRLDGPGGVLMMLDADHFKRVNDTFGHGAGDDCLLKIAALLRSQIRQGDLVARLGGEEFGVFLTGARQGDARLVGDRLVEGIELVVDGAAPHRVTLSAGAASAAPGDDPGRLLGRADAALYQAKADGRARMVIAPPPEPPPSRTAIGRRGAA